MKDSIEVPNGEITMARTNFMKTLKFLGKIFFDDIIVVRVRSEVKRRSGRCQRCHFSVAYARVLEKLSVLTQCSNCSKGSVLLI